MQDVLKNKVTITEAVNVCLRKDVHFVAFRLPGEELISLIIQKDPVIQILGKLNHILPEKGFIIAPFSRENNDAWLIQPDIVINGIPEIHQMEALNNLPERTFKSPRIPFPEDTKKDDYVQLIRESIRNIHTGEFDKVVLSRVKSIKGNFISCMPAIFRSLCTAYPNAFVYLFCVNGQCWAGATPEPFICSHNDELKTVSLAGTRPYSEQDLDIRRWNSKELEEQEYVTMHIEKILANFNIAGYLKNGPYVSRAGNLLHLRTDFSFPADSVGSRLPSLIASLHPTPAVCGMSTGKAMDFIRNTEKHNREY